MSQNLPKRSRCLRVLSLERSHGLEGRSLFLEHGSPGLDGEQVDQGVLCVEHRGSLACSQWQLGTSLYCRSNHVIFLRGW